jgi:hypothetical protein
MTTRSIWLGSVGVVGILVLAYAFGRSGRPPIPSPQPPRPGYPSPDQNRPVTTRPGTVDLRGRLSDPSGRPVANALIHLLQEQFANGRRELQPLEMKTIMGSTGAGCSSTVADGTFGCTNIPAGRYYLAASPSLAALGAAESRAAANANAEYETLLYPSTTAIDAARMIVVSPDATVDPIDFVFRLPPMSSVSGVVFDVNGRPVTNGVVFAMPRGEGLQRQYLGTGVHGGRIQSDGTFRIANLIPGEYSVRANVPQPPPAPGTFLPLRGSPYAIVRLSGRDVDSVRVSQPQVATLRGHVSFDADTRPLPPSAIKVGTQAWEFDDGWLFVGAMSGGPLQSLDNNYRFAVRTIPGRIALSVATPGWPDAMEWRVKAIHVEGIDVTDQPLVLGGQAVSALEIVLTNRHPRVSGRVVITPSRSPRPRAVLLFAQDRARWRTPFNRYFAAAIPTPDGSFSATVPPGSYFAASVPRGGLYDWQDPRFLEQTVGRAIRVSLVDGEVRQLDLPER